MSRRCPPGVFCIENYTIFMIFIFASLFTYLYFWKLPQSTLPNDIIINMNQDPIHTRSNFGYTNAPKDVLLNPYAPPLKNENYFGSTRDIRGGIPINIKTQGANAEYRQVGILTSIGKEKQILPLMGRPLITNRDKWQYYTMSEKNNIKLPISRGNRSCSGEYGCDKLYNGDNAYIEGYQGIFKVTGYDNDVMQYIPFV